MATQYETGGLLSLDAEALGRSAVARRVHKMGRIWPTAAGIALVLILCDLLLRPYPGHPRPVQEDRVDAPVLTMPYYVEGFSMAHFTPSRARLTGNAVLAGAPYAVILGDSYVEALQVNDQQTMGSVLEKMARAGGQPLNVRQYGWSGDSPAHYALVANQVEQVWKPRLVCVILNADDFTVSSLKDHWAEMRLHSNAPPAITPIEHGSDGRFRAMALWMMEHSGLVNTVIERGYLDILPTLRRTTSAVSPRLVEDSVDPEVVNADVQALKRAYGESLLIVLMQNPGITGGAVPTKLEALLRQSCAELNADCIATRQAFVHLRDRKQTFGFGFTNTLPQAGHINADGHRLVAELIWADYQRRLARSK